MCGIAGALVFGHSDFPLTDKFLNAMGEAVAHRGPDGAGTWIASDRKVGFAHRRLAIIDLSEKANQPMSTGDGALWITYNGEVYNHEELRAELIGLGVRDWKTDHSDTEVILQAFRKWGIACLQKLNGMFAFAIWDARENVLWLARDRIGIKPLYYSMHHGRLTFASEIKALLEDPDQERFVNEKSLYHFLSFITTPAPETLFDGIKKLPCATWLRADRSGQITEHRYWDVLDHAAPLHGISEAEIAERIRSELARSVKLRNVSDVPVGGFLSGGIDSSSTVALLSKNRAQPVKSFTIGYQGEYASYSNEMPYARLLAETVGAEYHEQLLSIDDVIGILPHMVKLQDEPIADPVCVPMYFVSKLARENGIKVCQAGEGADELFCGYPNWMRWIKFQRLVERPIARPLKTLACGGLRMMGRQTSFAYERFRRSAQGEPVTWSGHEMFTEAEKKLLLSSRLRAKFAGYSSVEAVLPVRRRFEEKAWERSHLGWLTYMDLNFVLPEWLLMRADKTSMSVGLEARVPFLDHKLVELAMSIPESVKIRGDVLKYILKRSVEGLIPDELIHRKKQGFGVPIYEWFFERLGDMAREEISAFCREIDLIDHDRAMALFDKRQSRIVHTSRQCWTLLNLAMWRKAFSVSVH